MRSTRLRTLLGTAICIFIATTAVGEEPADPAKQIPKFEVKRLGAASVVPTGDTTIVLPLGGNPTRTGPFLVLPLGQGWDLDHRYKFLGPDHLLLKKRGSTGYGSRGLLEVQVHPLSSSVEDWEKEYLGTFHPDGRLDVVGTIAATLSARAEVFSEKPKRPKDIKLKNGVVARQLQYSTQASNASRAHSDLLAVEVLVAQPQCVLRVTAVDYAGELDAPTVFNAIRIEKDGLPFESPKKGDPFLSFYSLGRGDVPYVYGVRLPGGEHAFLRTAPVERDDASSFAVYRKTAARDPSRVGNLSFRVRSVLETHTLQDSLARELERALSAPGFSAFGQIDQKAFKAVEGVRFRYGVNEGGALLVRYVAICRLPSNAPSAGEFIVTLTLPSTPEEAKKGEKTFDDLVAGIAGAGENR